AADELDLDDTIRSTAKNAGWLDLKLVPERHNAVKVLLLLDIGGSMSGHVRTCQELFSAARAEFKHLESFYFHNCPYESLWRDAHRRHVDKTPAFDVLHTYDSSYKLIFVGDASMGPYEITQPGGSVEHWNEEAGDVWMRRLTDTYAKAVWLNPVPEQFWDGMSSIRRCGNWRGRQFYRRFGGNGEAGSSDLETLERFRREQFLGRAASRRQALLVVIAQERVEDVPVGRDAIGPPVRPHQRLRLLGGFDLPRQH